MPMLLETTRREVCTRIEAAALRLFVRQGYAATSTREIAAAAGLTVGALYTHYRGKSELFAAVVDAYRARLSVDDSPLRAYLAHTKFPDDLPALAAAVRQLVREHRDYWLLWYVDVIEFEGSHFRSALAPRALLKTPGLQRRLSELSRAGRLRVDPSAGFVMVYMHLFNFYLVENIFGGRHHYGVDEDAAVALIVDVFLRGVLK